ncbi:hypothetical protein TREMEDRAFT_66145 [Tremella mesenterica DSM 1558]|uniref:uncharacterized protein n=1 Tax=Tremella mesenterica (strain ATCC 24925 / CBS 8224 / DSM 1558 / NBRC 9311 / NRRL Y-6157 / RJB 2259-6 / UBC 559-6) TaxID=578456 RepID=UPI00032BE4AF|nr:uncharacterized protein TREMEDRAFT_66145 [Tremella mesenterica DSM 1558]EIW65773.1 hypothetical protein TREMEDRAFT_66145 [Tremella mesenterica DSM 1558]
MTSRQVVKFYHYEAQREATQYSICRQLRRMTISAVRSALVDINTSLLTDSQLSLVEATYCRYPGKLFSDHPELSDSLPFGVILTTNEQSRPRNSPEGLYAPSVSQTETEGCLKAMIVERFSAIVNNGDSNEPTGLQLPIGKTWVSMFDSDSDRMGWVFNQRPAVCSNRRLIGLLAQWFRPLPLKGTVISSQCWLVGLVTLVEAEYCQNPGTLYSDNPDLSDSLAFGVILTSKLETVPENRPRGLFAASGSQSITKEKLTGLMVEHFKAASEYDISTTPTESNLPIGKTWVSVIRSTVWWVVYSKDNLSLEFGQR